MPAKALSLHIGLNFVNPDHYGGWDGELKACEFDAHDMKVLAIGQGMTPTVLLTGQATAANVVAAIQAAAKTLKSGDLFFLSYSGHGGQVPDTNGDETDPGRQDETWVLFDRQLVDDELWALWKKFKKGVRILVLSDSCHSGTVTRQMPAFPASGTMPRIRLLPPAQAARVYRANRALYDGIQKAVPAGERGSVKSSVILISGCQDNQFSLDGARNGLFTETLKKVWRKGAFEGNYRKFRDSIAQRMPREQTPQYTLVGQANAKFEASKPFVV
ncbi:MAG: caspase family protein [Verrucomicrobiales bacterium]|nr:caspase family protein [Verrucomicrobiales bacterium]